jgi:hypothetical protein
LEISCETKNDVSFIKPDRYLIADDDPSYYAGLTLKTLKTRKPEGEFFNHAKTPPNSRFFLFGGYRLS